MSVVGEVLSELSEEQRDQRFALLQGRLPAVWKAMRLNLPGEAVVVVPSVVPDATIDGATMQALEERFLFLTLLLRQPRLEMIYVTSMPVAPAIIEYYLSLLAGVIPSHARRRLHLVSAHDRAARPLAAKLLERPRILQQVRSLIPDPELCHLVPYVTTRHERDLALALGIPMYGADPRLFPLGTKTGCRRLFREEAVPHPLGFEDLHSADDVTDALAGIRRSRPAVERALVKLNDGVSGRGNASVRLDGLPAPGASDERQELERRVRTMAPEQDDLSVDTYLADLLQMGGVVEERLIGSELRSPSVQMRVTPLGDVELLSTHDQMLGGPTGQKYLGCRFPADFGYARLISAEAMKVGRRLAAEGALGRFAVDFVVTRETADGPWTPNAIELNLRKGGTTHPFLTLQFLTGGSYDPTTALFTAPSGREKHMVATDHLESPAFRGLTHDHLFDIMARHGLHFDQSRQVGVVFHMMSALSELGRIGLTAVGETPQEADATYRRAEQIITDEATEALIDTPLPPL